MPKDGDYYWIKMDETYPWEPARWDEDVQAWYVTGCEYPDAPSHMIIGPKLEEPHCDANN